MSVSTWFDYLYHKYIIHKRLQSLFVNGMLNEIFSCPYIDLYMSFVFAFGGTVLLWFHLLDIGILTHSCNYLMFTKIKIHPTLKRLFDKFHFDLSARTYFMKLIILITIYWLKKHWKSILVCVTDRLQSQCLHHGEMDWWANKIFLKYSEEIGKEKMERNCQVSWVGAMVCSSTADNCQRDKCEKKKRTDFRCIVLLIQSLFIQLKNKKT